MTLGISKCFAKSEFQTFVPNSEIGAVSEQTIELLQTSSQHYKDAALLSFCHWITNLASYLGSMCSNNGLVLMINV